MSGAAPMAGAAFAYTRKGMSTVRRCAEALPELLWEFYAPARLAGGDFLPLQQPASVAYGRLFREKSVLLFAGASGIAVRAVAPFLQDKGTDPAVLCTGEEGRFVIPLLSGHLGGANALAERLGAALAAIPVITTATEARGRFSPDRWAAEHGCAVSGKAEAKAVSAAILERELPLCCGLPLSGGPPPGTYFFSLPPEGAPAADAPPLGIYIGWDIRRPFRRTLRLIPRTLRLGLGCRRGVPAETLESVVAEALALGNLDPLAVKTAASIDRKRDEPGLLAFCQRRGWPLEFYTPEELRTAPGRFSSSSFVASVTGVDNVCERAAMVRGERLLLQKYARLGVTVAVAAEKTEVRFESCTI